MRGPCVTYEAVKRQLELLGHNVPDAAIKAYLADLQKDDLQKDEPRPASQLSGRSDQVELVRAQEPRDGDQKRYSLSDNFEATLNLEGAVRAAPETQHATSRHPDSCAARSNSRATGRLVSEEVMTRAQTILNEHHTGHSQSTTRHEQAPASDRLRSHMSPHITGTLQPRASTSHPGLDEPPANIAPDSTTARYIHPHPDPYYLRPSTSKPSRQPPKGSFSGSTARPKPAARCSTRLATAGEAAHDTWLDDDDDFEREYEYDDTADESPHQYLAHELPLGGEEHSAYMHAHTHVHRDTHPSMHHRNATLLDSPDEEECEAYSHLSRQEDAGRQHSRFTERGNNRVEQQHMHEMHGTSRWGQGRKDSVSGRPLLGSERMNRMRTKVFARHRDLSPFDASIEDNDREWENVLLEATGGAEVGRQAGQRRNGGEPPLGAQGDCDAWGIRDEWGEGATERSYSQVHYPQQQRQRAPLVANDSYIVGRSNLSGAARPIDRVARYQQLQKAWNKDRFLTKPKGQVLGYQEAFEHAHRRETADLQDLKESNKSQRPATAGSAGRKYVPPGQKRRDKLRWTVRQRMQWQD